MEPVETQRTAALGDIDEAEQSSELTTTHSEGSTDMSHRSASDQNTSEASESSENREVSEGQQTSKEEAHSIPYEQKDWISWKLSWTWLIFIVVANTGIIITLVCVAILSWKRNGFAETSDRALESHRIWRSSFAWKTLPAFVLSVFGIGWNTIINAAGQRQPYVELRKESSTAERTILLDYPAEWSLRRWWTAFQNRHYHLSSAFLLSLIFVGVPNLAASLFETKAVPVKSSVQLTSNSKFNQLANPLEFDYHTAFGAALATQVYGGIPTPWTTTEYAFQPYSLAAPGPPGNITANTTAYSAYLDCRSYSQSEVTIVNSAEALNSSITILVEDRGCPVMHTIFPLETSTLYGITFTTQNCTPNSGSSRVGLIAAGSGPTTPDQLSSLALISCTSSYWRTWGNLSVAFAADKYPVYTSFSPDPKHELEIVPAFSLDFEQELSWSTEVHLVGTTNQDDFSSLVFAYAKTINGSEPLDPSALVKATQTMFTSVYAIMSSGQIFQPGETATLSGDLTALHTRLCVVPYAFWPILAVMVLVLGSTLQVAHHVLTSRSILLEEPKGLLIPAIVLNNSDVMERVRRFRETYADERELSKLLIRDEFFKGRVCSFQGPHSRMAGLFWATWLGWRVVPGQRLESRGLSRKSCADACRLM